MMKYYFCGAMSAIGTGLTFLFGEWNSALTTLVIFIGVDYLLGLLVAWAGKSPKSEHGGLSSSASFNGLLKKTVILILILVAVRLDVMMGLKGTIRTAVVVFYISNEGLSIIENVGLLGMPLPNIVKKSIEALRSKSE